MVLGARPIGSRTIGDGTGESGLGVESIPGQGVAVGGGFLTATGAVGITGQGVVIGEGVLVGAGAQLDNANMQRLIGSGHLSGYPSPPPLVQPSFVGDTPREPYWAALTAIDGIQHAYLDQAQIASVRWELNGDGFCDFGIPTLDLKNTVVKIPGREVQVYRGNQMIWGGPIWRRRADQNETRYQAEGVGSYFKHRNVGRADRINYVPFNPSFEEGINGWALNYGFYSVVQAPPLVTVRSGTGLNPPPVSGDRYIKLEGTAPDHDSFIAQSFLWTVPVATSPEGDTFTLTAWCFVPGVNFAAPAFEGRGLFLERRSTTVPDPDPNLAALGIKKLLQYTFIPLDADTPKDVWIRMEIAMTVPPTAGSTEDINFRLYPPHGVAYWDEVTLTLNERLAFYGQDQALIFKGLVEHAQDPVYDKSDLNIGTNCPLTGVTRTREFFFANHQEVRELVDEFPTLNNGFDYSVEVTPTTRMATTYFPMKGERKPQFTLELGRNIASLSIEQDGTQTANSIIVLGEGDGSDREEGTAIDKLALEGVILEKVYNARPGSDIKTLDDQAKLGLDRFKQLITVVTVTTYEGGGNFIGKLVVGDIVPVVVKYGWIDFEADYRIVGMTLDPDNDTVAFDLNLADIYTIFGQAA